MGSSLSFILRRFISIASLAALMSLAISTHSHAQNRWASSRQKTSATESSASLTTPYIVLGHAQKIAQLRHQNFAWTLGGDGYVVAWTYEDSGWSPIGVRQVPNSTALAFEGGELLVFAPDHIAILTMDAQPNAVLSAKHAVVCEGGAAWRVLDDQRLCTTSRSGERKCTASAVADIDLRSAVCTQDAQTDCVSLRTADAARGWCTEQENVVEAPRSERSSSILHPNHGTTQWLSLTSDGWNDASSAAPPISVRAAQDGVARCFRDQSYAPCIGETPSDMPESSMVSARTLHNILPADHGDYFVFRDGWYGVSKDVHPAWTDVRALREYSSSEQRVWLDEEVLRSSVQNGVARVATCASHQGQAVVIDRDLSTGISRQVTRQERCPLRADYRDGELLLAYGDRLIRWDIEHETSAETAVRAQVSETLSSDLVATSSISRGCAYMRWDISLSTPTAGDAPVGRGICAQTAVPLPWHSVSGGEGGAAILLRGRHGSQLRMVDRLTLSTYTLQTDVDIPAHAQIYRRSDGDFFIVDPHRGTALLLDTKGQILASEALVVIDGRIWRAGDGGTLVSDDGHQLLATDIGVILDGVGVGPLAARTIATDRRRIKAQPVLFSSQLRTLGVASIPLRSGL